MNRNIHRLPTLLCGVAALVLSAGALANGQDRSNSAAQNSTPAAQSTARSPSMASTGNDASSATAQTKFDLLDTNHDGSISKEEAQASNALKAEFTRLDSNKDSKLSLTEFMSASNMASIKVDKNGKSKGY